MDKEAWNFRYQGDDLLWTEQPNRFLVAEAEGLTPGRALDLACGEGRNAVWMAEQGWQVTGVDFSQVALDKAQRLAERRGVEVNWVCADLLEYAPPGVFGLVIVFYLQLAVKERHVIFSRAASTVAPGGTLLLVAHTPDNIEHGYGGPRDPAVLYSADEAAADLTGLEIVRAEQITRPVDTADGQRQAIDALVRAERADNTSRN